MADDTNTAEREAAEQWLRDRYGAYRGHFAWRELEEAFLAGRASLAASAGSEPMAYVDRADAVNLARNLLDEPREVVVTRRGIQTLCKAVLSMDAVLSAHPSPPEGAGWRPIDTAPKDEVYRAGPNAYAEYILVWYPGAIAPIRACWWQSDSGRCNFLADGSYAVFPTVWMPLPAPPLPASEAKEL